MQDYEKCVAAGVNYLEGCAPDGFKDRLIEAVKEDRFYLWDVTRCVLAWSWADEEGCPACYRDVLEQQNLNTPETPESYGFIWDAPGDLKPLQAAWERRIASWQEDQVPA